MKLTDRSVGDLLAEFAAPAPTPGGGSASALAGALGTSLLLMVSTMARTREPGEEGREALADAAVHLHPQLEALLGLVDRDADAYAAVVSAYRLPKATDEEKTVRTASIRAALKQATEVPLEIMERAGESLAHGLAVARHGNPSAASDVGVAFELVAAGLRGAALNVRINLEGLADRAFAERTAARVGQIEAAAADAIRDGTAMLKA